jgi:hypothetical protein
MYSIPKYTDKSEHRGATSGNNSMCNVLQYVSETVHVADSARMCIAVYMKKPVVSRASAGWTERAGTGSVSG